MGLNDHLEKIKYAKSLIVRCDPDSEPEQYIAAYQFLSRLHDPKIEDWLLANIRYGKWWQQYIDECCNGGKRASNRDGKPDVAKAGSDKEPAKSANATTSSG